MSQTEFVIWNRFQNLRIAQQFRRFYSYFYNYFENRENYEQVFEHKISVSFVFLKFVRNVFLSHKYLAI
jgi:hypothetical protein